MTKQDIDSEQYLVYSDAGYGKAVRGSFPDEVQATAKAVRLGKKSHTAITVVKVRILDIVLEAPDAASV